MLLNDNIISSSTQKFSQAVEFRRKTGLPIISLGLGEPDFEVPDSIKQSIIEVLKTVRIGYTDPMGIFSLREKLAYKLKIDNSINCLPDNLIITAGSKQAFFLICLVLLESGDEAIIIDPSYVSYVPQIKIAEPKCKIVKVDIAKADFTLPFKEIEKSITDKTKMLVLNSPNNPTGYILNNEQLKSIYGLAEKYNFFIISDEVYEKLIFSSEKHFSIGSLENSPTRVITVNGFSKSFAMSGWGFGYACFPNWMTSKLRSLQLNINSNVCSFLQLAIDKAFSLENSFQKEYTKNLHLRVETIKKILKKTKNISLVPPKAGFFAFINIAKIGLDSNTFCIKLLEETGVATTPGIAFGISWDDHVRISFATSLDTLSNGMESISGFINQL